MLTGPPGGSRSRDDDEGAAAVEFALVVPVLLLVVFGIITFGIIFAQQLALGNAARQGARFGAVGSHTCADIEAETKSNVTTLGMLPDDVTITVTRDGGFSCDDATATPCAGSTPGDNVHVEAAFISEPLVPMVLVSEVDLSSEGTFRCEFS
jgi:Flp pilus assembly protein TadG